MQIGLQPLPDLGELVIEEIAMSGISRESIGRMRGELHGRRLSSSHDRNSKLNFTGLLETGTFTPLHAKFGPAP